MKNKGFTLTELLAVVIILALLSLVVGTSISGIVRESNEKLYETQEIAIRQAAEQWGLDHTLVLPTEPDSCVYVTLKKLKRDGYLENLADNSKISEKFPDTTKIKISSGLNLQDISALKYEVNPDSVDGCSIALDWIHEDTNENGVLDVGEVVTTNSISYEDAVETVIEESFYVIETPEVNDNTVKLLAAKCVNTTTWLQNDTYSTVAFDEGECDTELWVCYKSGTTIPITNVYANASIRGLVETYVIETLGLNANQGRLMLKDEAEALQVGHTDELYGTTTKWNFWLGSPNEVSIALAWHVSGSYSMLHSDWNGGVVYDGDNIGLRPVIELPLDYIQ